MEVINIKEKLAKFSDHWHPRIIGELNGQYVKLAKIKGEFVWHSHAEEDELFYVLKGELRMEFRDKTVVLQPGEMIVVPRGIEHRPCADEEVEIMLFEPKSTLNTGEEKNERTREELERI
jgi:mannose-6-phosphate isomerase-like protein (cupin superfamily)